MPRSPQSRNRMTETKRARYVNTGEASIELEGLLSAGQIRVMALAGEIPGAIKVRDRVLVPRYSLPGLVQELGAPSLMTRRPQPSTFDVNRAV